MTARGGIPQITREGYPAKQKRKIREPTPVRVVFEVLIWIEALLDIKGRDWS